VGSQRFWGALAESLSLVRWYARDHVLLCLVPAFFIAGAISVFVSQGAVMKYLGPKAKKVVAYPVAAVSGSILAVCSCTVLPLFASIHKRGAGLGPAMAFLYSGPAINVLAIVLTARVLGPELGIARAVGAISFAVLIGLLMHLVFRKEEALRELEGPVVMPDDLKGRALWQDGVYFAAMVGILVFANWGKPADGDAGVWAVIHSAKWIATGVFALALAGTLFAWFKKDDGFVANANPYIHTSPWLALTSLSAAMGCKSQERTSATAISAAVAGPAAQALAKAHPSRIVFFVGKEHACDCTRKSLEAGWAALQKALGTPAKLPVERLQIDTQGDKVVPYRRQKPMMALPAIYFVDGKDMVLELLQGEVSEAEIIVALKTWEARTTGP